MPNVLLTKTKLNFWPQKQEAPEERKIFRSELLQQKLIFGKILTLFG